jgi:hypothetical protein
MSADQPARSLGTFRWQLHPYCNVITLKVTQRAGLYTLDGYDDQCGAADRAAVVGTAVLNPDGSVGLGISSMTAPDPAPVSIHATLTVPSMTGTWQDSAGNNGLFVFTPGGGTGGPPRPVPANGIRPFSITTTQIAPGTVGAAEVGAGVIEERHVVPGLISSSLGRIGSAQIAPGAITAEQVAAGALDATHVAGGAVGATTIQPGAIHAGHLAAGAASAALGPIGAGQIAGGAVGSTQIAAGAVTAAHLAAGAVGSAHVAAGAVGPAHLAAGSVGAAAIAAGAVGATHLAPGVLRSLVVGECPRGRYMRGVTAAGAVICEPLLSATSSITLDTYPPNSGLYPIFRIGADGLPVIVTLDGSVPGVRVTKCGNHACTAGNISSIVDQQSWLGDTAMAIGRDGLPFIAYQVPMSGGIPGLRALKCGDPACASGNLVTDIDAPGYRVGNYVAAAIGADGFPILSHQNDRDRSLRVTKCADAACTSAVSTEVLGHPTVQYGRGTWIFVAADGLPLIAHMTTATWSLVLTRCGDAACTANNVTTTLDGSPTIIFGEFSMAIAPDGLPIMVYRDHMAAAPRVLKCGTPTCDSGNIITTVDDRATSAGRFTSVAVGADGLPIIGHYDDSAGPVRVIKCGNAACSADNLSTIVDKPPAGLYMSLAVGSDGLPVLVYEQGPQAWLRITKCGTQSCQ